jgi:hypothetical protein
MAADCWQDGHASLATALSRALGIKPAEKYKQLLEFQLVVGQQTTSSLCSACMTDARP